MKNSIYTLLLSMAVAASAPTYALDIDAIPGRVGEKIASAHPDGTLTLRGKLDARDLVALRALENVELLDLSDASIAAVDADTPIVAGRSQFEANHLPAYILFDSGYSRVILPSGLSVIESGAFAGSAITEIIIPEGVTSIGDFAFYGCHALRKVSLPSTLLSIGSGAFAECHALETINPESTGIRTLPRECFAGDYALRHLNTSGIESIGSRALARSGIERLDLLNVRAMEPFALADMPHLMILNAGTDTPFSEGALMNCSSLMAVNGIPDDIPMLFAANCPALENASILSHSSTVGPYALANTGASNLILGAYLSYIDENALHGMTMLSHIDATACGENPPAVAANSFSGIDTPRVRLKVADFTESIWQSHPVWRQFDIYSDNLSGSDYPAITPVDDIGISLQGSTLSISAPEAILSASIYDPSGNLLLSLPDGTTTSTADISSLPSGVAIISIRTATHFKATKIML